MLVVCPKSDCGASDPIGLHSHNEPRYICPTCHRTFAETTGTLRYGRKHPPGLILVVVTFLASGCPLPASVASCDLHERTVADWQFTAAQQAKTVHQQLVGPEQREVGQVQADQLYPKTQAGPLARATAISVFARLWLGGALSWDRAAALLEPLIEQVRAAARPGQPLLFAVDGKQA